eukprot:3780616-Amphidinium_carterae.1
MCTLAGIELASVAGKQTAWKSRGLCTQKMFTLEGIKALPPPRLGPRELAVYQKVLAGVS